MNGQTLLCETHEYSALSDMDVCPFCTYPILGKAYVIAETSHCAIGQVRKYSGKPYFSHPREIALRMYRANRPLEEVAAALLHDVLEDTRITESLLRKFFPRRESRVVDIVLQVTKPSEDMSKPRAERKAVDHAHYANGDVGGQTLKCFDIEHNESDITDLDPKFAKVWLVEAESLLYMLTKADWESRLWALSKVRSGMRRIGLEPKNEQLLRH